MKNLRGMIEIALVTAIICVLAPWSINIPISPVPVSLTIFALYVGIYAIGWKGGTIACVLYILLGLIGLPVFSNFSGGAAKLFGLTGGYIFGYVFICIIVGLAVDKFEKKIWVHAIAMVIGVAICYLFGTIWFVMVGEGKTFAAALGLCVFPFIPADIVKMIIALIVGPVLRKQVKKINNN